jgi:protein TonB
LLFLSALLVSAPAQSGVITPPRLIHVPPTANHYPERARRRGEQGLTELRCTLGVTGRLTDCAVRSSSGSAELDQASFRIAEEAICEPKRIDGQPVATPAVLPVRWVLAD